MGSVGSDKPRTAVTAVHAAIQIVMMLSLLHSGLVLYLED